ncbi:MAG TPA: hypothetical protein VNX65_01805 [Patescibacteria group bacterium]|jgi:hypothetical protein|nr:hypothetical protein [Patescibacteria group bacterium]
MDEANIGLRSMGVYLVVAFVLLSIAAGGIFVVNQLARHNIAIYTAPLPASPKKPETEIRPIKQSVQVPDSKLTKPGGNVRSDAGPDSKQIAKASSDPAINQAKQPDSNATSSGIAPNTTNASASKVSPGSNKVPDTGPSSVELISTAVLMSVAVYLAIYIVNLKLRYKRYWVSKLSRGSALYF